MSKPHLPELATTATVGNPIAKLFAYHLRDAVGLPSQTQISTLHPQAEAIWQQCIELGQTLAIPALVGLKTVLRCYQSQVFTPNHEDQTATLAEQPYLTQHLDLIKAAQKDDQYARELRFHTTLKEQGLILDGEFYPQRIHDTYTVALTLRLTGKFPLTQLQSFAPLRHIQPFLGSTYVLLAEPLDTASENDLSLANACATQFLQQQSHCRPTAQGQFFGNPLFEYTPPDPHHPDRPLHLWVWLNRNPEALGLIDQPEPYHALINLLCALHKSRFAFAQATDCYQQAQDIAQALETQVNQLSQGDHSNLEQWKDWLQDAPATAFNHARLVRDLEDHRITLEANKTNFASRLAMLQKYGQADDDLGFLDQWLNTVNQHQRQIGIWQRYLANSQPLFQQLIDTIRGLVDIAAQEQAQADARREMERDRTLQAGIAAVGTGLAVSGITSQVAPRAIVAMPAEPQHSSWLYWPAFVTNALFHISLGLCFALIVYKTWLPKSNTRSSNR